MKISKFLHDLSLAVREFELDWDAFSLGQLQSKEWVVEIMKDIQMVQQLPYGMIYVLGGWYGVLPAMISLKRINYEKIRSFDIDKKCWDIANRINRTDVQDGWKFQATTLDINELQFDGTDYYDLYSYAKKKWFAVQEGPTTIINTSCEHMSDDWYKKVPEGQIVILQSNNFLTEKHHQNCVKTLEEMKEKYPMNTIYYDGKMNLPKYTRFMLVGIK